ncbi:olfactory receptor 51I2-like [Eublepharis macularius]|uniref:Olfactory receptor 51I2-like n=1 Tax=Eublepharis macularius TaxID=481883 RepID=A0AA97J3T5_EUBMA|nr:olfactory receptor 51I2-like [Eublepharis macularius]
MQKLDRRMFLFTGSLRNQSFASPTFLMTGIPGLEGRSTWLAILFCSVYAAAILGNSIVILVVAMAPSLHKPMYLFLSMLAGSELGVSLSTLPTVLSVFLFDAREIGMDACLAQMFFIHCFSIMDSGVLWAMALDHFVAIYNPLQYGTILTNSRIAKIGFGIAMRSFILMTPLPFLLKRLPFCRVNVLPHPYCLHSNLIWFPCADTTVNSRCGMFIVLSTFGLDSLFIVLSYVMIVKTVLGIASKEGRLQALNTCVSHICAVLVYYVPMIGVAMAHRFSKHASPLLYSVMANLYLLVPPVVNPIVYSIKTKEIRMALSRSFFRKRFF